MFVVFKLEVKKKSFYPNFVKEVMEHPPWLRVKGWLLSTHLKKVMKTITDVEGRKEGIDQIQV